MSCVGSLLWRWSACDGDIVTDGDVGCDIGCDGDVGCDVDRDGDIVTNGDRDVAATAAGDDDREPSGDRVAIRALSPTRGPDHRLRPSAAYGPETGSETGIRNRHRRRHDISSRELPRRS
ncbi:hypothetical protein [Halorubrum trueperi]|uniref:Uncharacterized protein n=1 Tax=Halorubrum trueperi TaxID=2004704 RepID=A0ABD5URJ6_9EURY